MRPLTQSYVHGASAVPLLGDTIGRHMDKAVSRWGGREALVVRHQHIRWTYEELNARAEAFAAGLLALGLAPGDRVGIWSPNNAEWVVTQFATAKAGLILVNINPAYRLAELEYALNKTSCKALVTATSFKSSDYLAMIRELAPKLSDLQSIIQIGGRAADTIAFEEVAAMAGNGDRNRLTEIAGQLQFDDPINIQFTSGTTGRPKGATLTHHNILNNGFFVGEAMSLTPDDRICIPVPLYHCFGMVLGNLAGLTHGAAMVFPGEAFDSLAVLETIEAERCTTLYGVPTMFIAELEQTEFRKFDLGCLRTGIMAGAPCPVEIMKRVIDDMHMSEVTIAYGMTETGPVSFQTAADDPLERRVRTVGRVQPHIEAKIIDRQGKVVAPGVPGELCVRGYCVMPGYWDDPEKTAGAIDRAGWIHTEDIATIDEEGYCDIVGRIKDMLIRGGENIYPREIEEFLYGHPDIDEVQVFGVPDPKYGEEVCAWIRLREGASASPEDVRAFCKGQIAHFKIPRYIRFVEEFPMTVTGKIQKYKMREAMAEELGLAEQSPA
jgi:fatty-acyl-CoA synthase